ncbi:hypothetical protein [Segatella buccae]|uniref:hypothetical protein n=1 Tax=Segatella buccae TaxID=28126 RepID=UPI0022E23364|nr:hypothetical protein [Segatella buccae]
MKSSITINTGDNNEVTFSVTIEDMPINNIRKLERLPRQVAEHFVDTMNLGCPGDGACTEENREKFIQSLLGTE